MEINSFAEYQTFREKGAGFFQQKRGFIEVSGSEAEMFLNGLVTNDVKKLPENSWMLAAFPNAQGRLLALVRVLRRRDKFYFDMETATGETVLKNLERFTLAGDFKVKDLTGDFSCIGLRGNDFSNFKLELPDGNEIVGFEHESVGVFSIKTFRTNGLDVFVPQEVIKSFTEKLISRGAIKIGEEAQKIIRIESGLPLYGVDMDETNVVLETGLDEAVSFNKGCYIGQEIIARIHFRGHVAKKLTGLIFEDENAQVKPNDELKSSDGKNAGRITSVAYSPTLKKMIALAYVRYDYLAENTPLQINDSAAQVKDLPFVR